MIKEYSLNLLQKAINKALFLDEEMPRKLNMLQGKVIELVITPLNVHFFMCFADDALHLQHHYAGTPDTTIHSSPSGLIRLSLLPPSQVRSLFNDSIRISGDVELGQRLKALFDNLDIDWEGHLAHFTGDVVAYQLGSFVRRGISFKRQFDARFCRNVSEYVQEECHLLPTRVEVDDFLQEVDDLNLTVERLAAHIHQFLAQHEID